MDVTDHIPAGDKQPIGFQHGKHLQLTGVNRVERVNVQDKHDMVVTTRPVVSGESFTVRLGGLGMYVVELGRWPWYTGYVCCE